MRQQQRPAATAVGMMVLLYFTMGVSGAHVAVLHSALLLCTQGGRGYARSLGLITADSVIDDGRAIDLRALGFLTCMFFWLLSIVDSAAVAYIHIELARTPGRLRRLARAGVRGGLLPRLRAAAGAASAVVMFALILSAAGAGASHVASERTALALGSPPTTSLPALPAPPSARFHKALSVARDGTSLIPGEVGAHVRRALDTCSLHLIDHAAMPAFLNATDTLRISKLAGLHDKTRPLKMLDSGAGLELTPTKDGAVPGSLRRNTTSVSTANGVTVPEWKCDKAWKVGMEDGSVRVIVRRNCVVVPQCPHDLISIGRIALDAGVSTLM